MRLFMYALTVYNLKKGSLQPLTCIHNNFEICRMVAVGRRHLIKCYKNHASMVKPVQTRQMEGDAHVKSQRQLPLQRRERGVVSVHPVLAKFLFRCLLAETDARIPV